MFGSISSLLHLTLASAIFVQVQAGLDAHVREALCLNQQAICTVSCQNKVAANTCNRHTLAWTCSCTGGTDSLTPRSQFPIPFKLCRNDLMVCLEACLENKAPEQQLQQLNAKRKHVRRHSKTEDDESQIALELLVNDDDYDQDDFDAFDEIHRLHQKLRLESDPYFCKEEDREQVMSANKRQRLLHKEEWFSSQWSKHSKIEKQAGLAIYSQDLQRNSDCTAHCQDKLACGTVTASDYATGLDSVFDSSY